MAQIIVLENKTIRQETENIGDGLKSCPGIVVNGPPRDERCDCCGRHMSELKPFGGPGDPLVGDFTGALFIKRWRWFSPYDAEAEKAYKVAESRYEKEGFESPKDYLMDEYGKEKGEDIYDTVDRHGAVDKSWECRDCAVLDEDEYFEKLRQS